MCRCIFGTSLDWFFKTVSYMWKLWQHACEIWTSCITSDYSHLKSSRDSESASTRFTKNVYTGSKAVPTERTYTRHSGSSTRAQKRSSPLGWGRQTTLLPWVKGRPEQEILGILLIWPFKPGVFLIQKEMKQVSPYLHPWVCWAVHSNYKSEGGQGNLLLQTPPTQRRRVTFG